MGRVGSIRAFDFTTRNSAVPQEEVSGCKETLRKEGISHEGRETPMKPNISCAPVMMK